MIDRISTYIYIKILILFFRKILVFNVNTWCNKLQEKNYLDKREGYVNLNK